MTVVRALAESDRDWLRRVWTAVEGDLGSWFVVGARSWHTFWKASSPRERWVGVPEVAFAHYRTRLRDGVAVLGELGVLPEARRRGYARALLDAIPRPLELKTDSTNEGSNAFYQSIGGVLVGNLPARSDRNRILNAYVLP